MVVVLLRLVRRLVRWGRLQRGLQRGLERGLLHPKALLLGALGASGAPGRRSPSGPRPSAPKCGPRAGSFHMTWPRLASDSDSML